MSSYVKRTAPPEIEHGTVKGYNQHKHRGIPSCDDCREAWKADRNTTGYAQVVTPEQKAWVDGNGKVAANDLSTSDTKQLEVAAHTGYVARLVAGWAVDQDNGTQEFAGLCAELGLIDEPEQAAIAAQAGKDRGPGPPIKRKVELKTKLTKPKPKKESSVKEGSFEW